MVWLDAQKWPRISAAFLILVIICGGKCMVMNPSVNLQHMKVMKHLAYGGYNLDAIPDESTASTTAQWFGMMPTSNPRFQMTPQISTNSCSARCMMMDSSNHPHHIKVVHDHGYVHKRCGNYSRWVRSLNDCTAVWFGFYLQQPRISGDSPNHIKAVNNLRQIQCLSTLICIRHIQIVWAHWYAAHGHTVAALNSYTHTTSVRYWVYWSLMGSIWCHYVMVEADSHLKMLHPF